MKITETFLTMGMVNGTLNQAQFELLDQSYPPIENWENLIIGKELSLKQSNLFLFLRGNFSTQTQEQIIQNYQLVANFHKKPKKEEHSSIEEIDHTKMLKIYCDGACKGNPGKAGSGLAIYESNKKPILLYGDYEEHGTNNTAELNALYKALELASKSPESIIYSDSKYSIDCISKWAIGWKKNGWKKKGGEIKNLETIQKSHELYLSIQDKIELQYVKGHAGIEGNELADRMAGEAINAQNRDYQVYDYSNIDTVLALS